MRFFGILGPQDIIRAGDKARGHDAAKPTEKLIFIDKGTWTGKTQADFFKSLKNPDLDQFSVSRELSVRDVGLDVLKKKIDTAVESLLATVVVDGENKEPPVAVTALVPGAKGTK